MIFDYFAFFTYFESWYCGVKSTIYTFIRTQQWQFCIFLNWKILIKAIAKNQLEELPLWEAQETIVSCTLLYGEGTNLIQIGYANKIKMASPQYIANMVRRTKHDYYMYPSRDMPEFIQDNTHLAQNHSYRSSNKCNAQHNLEDY